MSGKAAKKSVGRARKSGKKGGAAGRPINVMTLSDLDQLRVLADPLRVRILEALGEERTTKQVAERIGEKPTKLYHHVEALEKVGLIRLRRTRRNRGTLEKYYQVVALSFRPDSSLFPKTGYVSTAMDVVSNLLGKAGHELQELAACSDGMPNLKEEAILGFVEVRAREKEIQAIKAKIDALVKDLQRHAGRDRSAKDVRRYRLILGYYPLIDPRSAG